MAFLSKLDRRLSGNVAVKLGSELVGRVATFALSLLIANRLGETAFGVYSYGLALGFVLAQLADMGLQLLLSRDVAMAGRSAAGTVRAALHLKLWLSLPVVALLLLTTTGRPPAERAPLLLLGLALLGQTFLDFATYVYRGQQRLLTEAWLLTAARLLTAALAGVAVLQGAGLIAVGIAYLAATSGVAAYALLRLRREGWLTAPPDVAYGALLRQALPLGIAIFLSIAYTRLAVFLLDFMLGAEAVAQYSAAQRLVEPAQIVPAALLAAVFPAFAHALRHDPPRARRLGVGASLLLAAGGALLAAFFWFGAPVLVPLLYGAAFREAVPVLQFLGLSALPAFVNYNLTHMIIARGQQALSSVFVALMLLLHAAVSWQLIPSLGPVAPAISVTFAELFLLISCTATLLLTRGRPVSSLAGTQFTP